MNDRLHESRKYRGSLVYLKLIKYSFFFKSQKETEGRDFWDFYYLVNPVFAFTFPAKCLFLTQVKMGQAYLLKIEQSQVFWTEE